MPAGEKSLAGIFFVLNVNISVLSPSEGFEFSFLFAYSWRVVLFPKVVEKMDKSPQKVRQKYMTETRAVAAISSPTDFITKPEPITEEQMQADFDYYIAQRMLEKMQEKGLITVDEFNKITAVNRKKFSPYLAAIME